MESNNKRRCRALLKTLMSKAAPLERCKKKAKMHNHPLGFGSVANRPPGVLILQ
jgi:hypothetical protein